MSDRHEDLRDNVGVYLLGALSSEEATEFERHLATCPTCREELERLRVAADALPRAAPWVPTPPGLKASVMRAVAAEAGASPARERRSRVAIPGWGRRRGWRVPLATALGGAAAALAILAGAGALDAEERDPPARLVAAEVDRSRLPGADAALTVPRAPGAPAVLQARGLPDPEGDDVYQVWYQDGGDLRPGTVFAVTRDGAGAAVLDDLSGVEAVLVTREPAGGSRVPSEDPVVRAPLAS